MTRILLRCLVVSLLSTGIVFAAPPKKGGGDMTFEPETVEHAKPTPAPAPVAPPKRTHRGKMQSPSEPAPAPGAQTKTLDRALKLYDAKDYATATIELNKVIEGQTKDDEAGKERAEFFMGKALYQMEYWSAALNGFDRIVQKGPQHRYYNKTLQWLASLNDKLPESSGVLDRIGNYSREDLDQGALELVRDKLYYLLGRYHYSKANFKDAIALFSAVPEKSEFFPPAKYFEGMTYVRQNQGKVASESFKAILRKVKAFPDPDKVPKVLREYEELSNLTLGRIFYTTGQYDLSIKYYEKLDQQSPDWLPSLFEASWAYYMKDGDSKALGNIHSIASPFFENEFYPESLILKAVIYYERCNYDRSQEAIDEFNVAYPSVRKDLEEALRKFPDNAQFYDYAMTIRRGQAGFTGRFKRAVEGALEDRTLGKNLSFVADLDRELKSIETSDPSWKSTAVAANILQDLTLQRSLAANEAGNLARTRLKRLAGEIRELEKQSLKIEYETLGAFKGQLQSKFTGEAAGGPQGRSKYNEIKFDDEHQVYPFTGEYWRDELGYYRFRVQNRCGK